MECNCWSLRCSWSMVCRRCSNYIFILDRTPGFSGLRKDYCKMRWETFKFWDLVHLILDFYGKCPFWISWRTWYWYCYYKIVAALIDDEIVFGVYLDLGKTFDTVNHGILIKLYTYGIRGIVIEWFRSYLSDRCKYISYCNNDSSPMSITCGIPKGSILGPLSFLLYVNDIYNVSVLFTLLFADDTNVLCKVKVLIISQE